MFQSLSGFQVRCNLLFTELPDTLNQRFNPYRVFKFVATSDRKGNGISIAVFQSLSGFQVRCNFRHLSGTSCQPRSFNPYRVFKFVATPHLDQIMKPIRSVSIPIGFSSSLQHFCSETTIFSSVSFQSLSGFQVRCNPYRALPALCREFCFNPYRVFKFVATGGGA